MRGAVDFGGDRSVGAETVVCDDRVGVPGILALMGVSGRAGLYFVNPRYWTESP